MENKLLTYILQMQKQSSTQSVPRLAKAQKGKQVKSKLGENVIVDGKKMNTYSDEYENVYKKGIGQWVSYDKESGEWKKLANNLPDSAYKNAEFVSGVNDLPEVTVSAKMNSNMSAASKKAKQQQGSYEDYVKREQSTVPKWAGAMGFNNKEADKKIYDENYNNIINTRTYQNLVDAIPQRENESRIDYMNRFDQQAGKNSVARARAARVSEPFEPSNLNKLGQWGWKGINHTGAGFKSLFTSNPTDFMSTMQRGIDRGNQPVNGMTADEAKQVGITQPFETADDLAYNTLFKPALMAGDNLMNPTGKQARAFNSRNLGASDEDKIFTSLLNPINYITGSELLSGGKGLAKATRVGEGLETAGKFLTESTPLKNAWKHQWLTPNAERLTGKMQRQIFGDPAYESFLKYGPTTQPERPAASQQAQWLKFNREASPVYNTGTGENMQIAGTTLFDNNGLRIEADYPYAYFSEGSPWYGPKRSSSMAEALGQERRLVPKQGANLEFYPAGEASIVMNPEELTKQTINSYAGRRRVLSPFQDAFKPEAFDVYNAQPHWRKGYQKVTNPESIIKPKPIVEPEVRFGRDDMGMFRRRGDTKTYILKNDGEFRMSPTIFSRHPGFLNETEYNELQDLYNRPGVRENLQKEYSRMNLITDEHGNVPVLEHHLSSRNNYNDFIENQVEKAFYTRDNPVNNEGWPQGYSIGDSYSNSPSFADMYKNSFKRKFSLGLEKIDKSLGSLIPTKQAPKVDYNELENSINKRLASGMGIKKTSEPLSIKISKGSDNVMPNEFQTYINGQRSGGIGLRQNMDAYSNNKKLSEILFPNAQDAWRSAPGFRKTGDYPFNLTGKADEYYNKGLSGEFNAAINDVLKEKGYGNILSGGTGHTPLGKSRWDNLVNKGVAEKFGEKFNESFYKLKEDGGPIVDPMGQWAHPGQVTRIPGSNKNNKTNITMKDVNYPVLGIGSNGGSMMMYPEQEYEFNGSSYVDEYPMMGKGGEMIRRADGSYSKRGLWDNIRANKGSGKKPTKEMLEQERKIKAKNMENGGTNNAGFEALPEYVQAKILSQMGYGGYYNPYMAEGGEANGSMALGQIMAVSDKMNKLRQFISPEQNLDPWIASKLAVIDDSTAAISDYMMYNPEAQGEGGEEEMGEENEQEGQEEMMANGGYVVTRSNDRKGKTHKVTGPGGVVKYFGDSKLGQHPKDPERKAAFYARHKKNLDGNPFFRAFARKTWEDGGSTFSGNAWYQDGGDYDDTNTMNSSGAYGYGYEMGGYIPDYQMAYGGAPQNYYGNQAKNFTFASGGRVGQEMEVTPQEAEMLRQQGYQFEIL